MKDYDKCPKCNQSLRPVGEQRGFYDLARCNCDYTEPGAKGSQLWRGVHVLAPGSLTAETEKGDVS